MSPLPRVLLFILATLVVLFSIATFHPLSSRALPFPLSARSPSLFPKSAIITLTDDNSTFFLARPAAFGPELPEEDDNGGSSIGLTGRLVAVPEGEDGCGEGEGSGGGDDDGESEDGLGDLFRKRQEKEEDRDGYIRGRIVLLPRGGCGFLEKVLWAQRRGALAVIVGDNVSGRGLVTMYAKGDISNVTIPSIFTTHTTASLLSSLIPRPPPFAPTLPKSPKGSPSTEIHYRNNVWGGKHQRDGDQEGLWITLTCTPGPASPFLDTLLVLVVSPLGTLGIVYTMLAIRAKLQRRRWRAPKSVVESLPVRVYTMPAELQAFLDASNNQNQEGRREASKEERKKEKKKSVCSGMTVSEGDVHEEEAAVDGVVSSVSGDHLETTIENDNCSNNDDNDNDGDSITTTTAPSSSSCSYNYSQILCPSINIPSSSLECVVCLEDYIPNVSRVMKLPCGHEFHVGCITPWLVTRRRTCPICKGDVVKMVREKGSSNRGVVGYGSSNTSNGNGSDRDLERGGWQGWSAGDEEYVDDDEESDGEERFNGDVEDAYSRSESEAGPGWRVWAIGMMVGMVGGGSGRSVRGLVLRGEEDDPHGHGNEGEVRVRTGSMSVNERTPLIMGGERGVGM